MGKQKLLIADTNDAFRLALADALQENYHVLCCRNGKEALALLCREKPDILVLDLLLPELDGISLLQAAVEEEIFPKVLATTRFLNSYILEAAEQLGVAYLMRKPCDVRATAERIADLGRTLSPPAAPADPRANVTQLLHTLGIPAKLNGYIYLREAILLMAEDPSQSITKELYPAVGQLCSSTAVHVERCIRSAIATAWRYRDEQLWQKFFLPGSGGILPRPTNAAFISQLAEFLTLSRKKQNL